MKISKRYLGFIAIAVALLLIPLWYAFQFSGHQDEQQHIRHPMSQGDNQQQTEAPRYLVDDKTLRESNQRILAKDLSLSMTMYMDRLTNEFSEWVQVGFLLEDERVLNQIKEHRHFKRLAFLNNQSIKMLKGEQDDVLQTQLHHLLSYAQPLGEIITSKPYHVNEKPYLLMAYQTHSQTWLIGEVDLYFLKQFIGQVASVADANGQFFIGEGDTTVQFKAQEKSEKGQVTEDIPELGWKILLQSEETEERPHYPDGEVVIQLNRQIDIEGWLETHPNFALKKRFKPYYVVKHQTLSTESAIEALEKEEDIVSAEPNYYYDKQQAGITVPNDEFYKDYQWNLFQIKAEQGWNITGGEEQVILAILDTGIDPNHADISGRLIEGFNAFDETNNANDGNGHGTHVAGIAAAVTNNVTGIAGISWYNSVMPVKVLDDNGQGSLFEIAAGIRWATDNGAKVINMSLGDSQSSNILHEAIRYAYERDVLLIAASGNDNVPTPMYPAAYEEVLAVSAVDHRSTKAIFSNYGNHIDVAAPGHHIPSLFPGGEYVFMSGTSMAAPHVAGLGALIRSIRTDLTHLEVMEIIRQTADDLGPVGFDPFYGYGQINVATALRTLTHQAGMNQENEELERRNLSPWLRWIHEMLQRILDTEVTVD